MARRETYLDGLRGIAILMVVACHTLDHYLQVPQGFAYSLPWKIVQAGHTGVSFFFVLSSFSLFLASRSEFFSSDRPLAEFYLRRALRILPGWWTACALTAVRCGLTFKMLLPYLLMYFGFERYKPGANLFDADWSIFVEVIFYLTVPLLFLAVRNLKSAFLFLCFSFGVQAAWLFFMRSWGRQMSVFIIRFPLYFWPCFAFGILIYFLEPKVRKAFDRPWARVLLDGLALWLVVYTLYRGERWVGAGFALVLLSATSSATLCGSIARWRWLGLYGRCCYSIYLFHFLMLEGLEPVKVAYLNFLGIGRHEVILAFLSWFPLVALASLAVGLAGYYGIERPFIRLSRRAPSRLRSSPSLR